MPSTSSRNRAQFVAGNLKSPGYRFARAINVGLLPKEDPALREATPQTVSSRGIDEVRKYYTDTVRPDLTAIVVIGDVSAEEAKSVIEKWFGGWKASGAKPDVTLPNVPLNDPSATTVPDPSQLQDTVDLSQLVGITRFDHDHYPLQLDNHVLLLRSGS